MTRRRRSPPRQRGERLVFVGGAPRSGTTLVQNMLDCHPEILGGPEFLNLDRIVEVRNRIQGFIARGSIDAFCSAPEADRLFARLIEDLLLPLADRHGARLLSEKTPSNALVFLELLELFPAARCVFVLRDPRAVVASMLEVGARAEAQNHRAPAWTHSLPAAVEHVRRCLIRGFAAADARPDRVHLVAYEALVTDPEAETRRLCAFLGLPWTAAMLAPSRQAHLGETPITSASRNLWYQPASFRRDPDPGGMHKWKTQAQRAPARARHPRLRRHAAAGRVRLRAGAPRPRGPRIRARARRPPRSSAAAGGSAGRSRPPERGRRPDQSPDQPRAIDAHTFRASATRGHFFMGRSRHIRPILAAVPHPDDQHAAVVHGVDDDVRAAGMDARGGRELRALARHFRVVGQELEGMPQPRVIPLGLRQAE